MFNQNRSPPLDDKLLVKLHTLIPLLVVELHQKSYLNIEHEQHHPKPIMEKLDLKKGDIVSFELRDNEIVLKLVVIIDKSQAWFWSNK
ncbi:MAG: AbrB/MazE/SpoVT family DNA-binding domain-containing protein [Atribacterota bacterium]|jgi:hypothetical protein|nr:AbrB/MazE/SpoVT family DNA-binding domain-containing protein [Atribacterota bacterium]MDD4896864.1 AbrB/MazE/SpoVT family DNA-binding domain-containing protein [Atribacterota bacterium]MDD5637961.1 AbrB/MazE/SpoVT family DNA-binding domain-containing protein [Atribacterota bacterium]